MKVADLSLVVAALCSLSRTGSAQDIPRGDAFVGYSYVSGDLGSGSHTGLNGYEVTTNHNVPPWLAIVADTSSHWGSVLIPVCIGNSCTVLPSTNTALVGTISGGTRASFTRNRFTPFARALFGVAIASGCTQVQCETKAGFAQAYGGGVDLRVTERRLGLRFEGDVLQTRLFDGTQNDFRFTTGLVIFLFRHSHQFKA